MADYSEIDSFDDLYNNLEMLGNEIQAWLNTSDTSSATGTESMLSAAGHAYHVPGYYDWIGVDVTEFGDSKLQTLWKSFLDATQDGKFLDVADYWGIGNGFDFDDRGLFWTDSLDYIVEDFEDEDGITNDEANEKFHEMIIKTAEAAQEYIREVQSKLSTLINYVHELDET